MPQTDILIIGGGIAGLSVASKITNKQVTIITKKDVRQSNSTLAQGGIAAAMSRQDSWQDHFQDTLEAGCYQNNTQAVELMVKNGPQLLKEWLQAGFAVDRDAENQIRLGKEGAHQKRRILHAGGDQTGKVFIETMLNNLSQNIQIKENLMVQNLLIKDGQCYGAVIDDTPYYANYTILATGGIGGLYETNSNNQSLAGDGLAMAYRAGCQFKDLEFVQFHPSLLFVNNQGQGLISEAVRGEGAVLITNSGIRIMDGVHPMKDLAPRDIVARTIYDYQQKGEPIYLDISMIEDFQTRFPSITRLCQKHGIDLDSHRIPIAPGAHFHMGGVQVNEHAETSIQNLYAVGETACQGVHGANRLASNSLLEGLVFGSLLGERLNQSPTLPIKEIPLPKTNPRTQNLPSAKEIQHMMTANVGIIRTRSQLQEALNWFESFKVSEKELPTQQLQLWNMLQAGWLITKAALERKASIGAHYIKEERYHEPVKSKKID